MPAPAIARLKPAYETNPVTEAVAYLEHLLKQLEGCRDYLVLPRSIIPFPIDEMECGAVAATLDARLPRLDVTYNPRTQLFVIVSLKHARDLNDQYRNAGER